MRVEQVALDVADQRLELPDPDVDERSVKIEVEVRRAFQRWERVAHFAGSGPEDTVFVVDPADRSVHFGDGVRGMRPRRALLVLGTAAWGFVRYQRGVEAVRQDRAAYDLPPGDPRPASLASPVGS